VTTTKTETTAIDSLAGSSAVDRETLDTEFQPDGVPTILNVLPGVTTSITARDPGTAVNIRGLQDFGRVNVVVEGARQNFQRSGHNANGVFYLDPEMIKRVDVTRGPTSTVYGSGAIGGVVAFDLLDADDILRPGETSAIRLRGRTGSNGASRLGSATGAVRVGNFDVLVQGNLRREGNYRDGDGNIVADSGQETDSYLGKARWRFAPGHLVTATAIKYKSDFTDRPTDTSTTRRDSRVDNEQYTLGYRFKRADVPLMDFAIKVYRNKTDLAQTRINNSIFEPAGSFRTFNIVTDGFDVSNTSRFDFGVTKLAITVGADGFRDTVETSDRAGNGDELTPGGQREVYGAFVQSKLTLFKQIDLIGALRYDSYSLEGGNNESSGSRVSPKITLGWTPIKGFTVYSTYAEGYRAPSITETLIDGLHPQPSTFALLPNPNLRPEVAKNVEAGVNLKYGDIFAAKDKFRFKIVGFRNEVSDYINGVFNPSAGVAGQYQYQNISNATLHGVEIEGAYDAGHWFFSVKGQRIRGTDDETGNALITVGPDSLITTLGVRMYENKVVAGVRSNMFAGQKRVSDTALHTDGYTTVDLFAKYALSPDATLHLNIDNLFDKDYRKYPNQSDSPGMTARVGLTMRFGR
ncbi:MAG: TonB-dependent hemoglobin/transferrin/lactoferrin family receptor, partial [Hyphomicrobiaceae bacterium]|nr:TonB-dependent hemoglobin/transferrin/lactoferrin family receptor [Hyphomicrobiaceae bacterium]